MAMGKDGEHDQPRDIIENSAEPLADPLVDPLADKFTDLLAAYSETLRALPSGVLAPIGAPIPHESTPFPGTSAGSKSSQEEKKTPQPLSEISVDVLTAPVEINQARDVEGKQEGSEPKKLPANPTLVEDGDDDSALRARFQRARVCLDKLARLFPQNTPGARKTFLSNNRDVRFDDADEREPPNAGNPGAGYRSSSVPGRGSADTMRSPPGFAPLNASANRFGRFEILRELGSGGCGIVFLAYDPLLRRQVALKVPRLDVVVNPDLRRRFVREARAAAILDHPNVVPVYEAGEEGPACYIASAYCEGLTLDQWIQKRQGPVPVHVAAMLVAAIADGVQHAHQRNILHRDIKPSNVLIEPRRAGGTGNTNAPDNYLPVIPKLTDFGLAKLLENDADDTQSGALIGTPRYMAPEQAMGRIKEIGPPTDVYALGVILYETLTSRPPFVGESDLDTLHRIRTEEPIAPKRLREGLPRDLNAICLKCLEKEPARRYQSASDLAADLRRFWEGQPTLARPIRWPERIRRTVRREPVAALLMLICLFFIVQILINAAAYSIRMEKEIQKGKKEHQLAIADKRHLTQYRYAANLNAAARFWQVGDLSQAAALLSHEGFNPAIKNLLESPAIRGEERDFAGYFLWRRCGPAQPTWSTAGDPITVLAYSPRGNLLAVGGKNGTIYLWDMSTAKPIAPMLHHDQAVLALAWAPDGTKLVSSHEDGILQLWDISTQQCTTRLTGLGQPRALLITARNILLGVCQKVGLQRWDLATATHLPLDRELQSPALALAISSDESIWITRPDGRVAVCDANAEKVRQLVPGILDARQWTHAAGLGAWVGVGADERLFFLPMDANAAPRRFGPDVPFTSVVANPRIIVGCAKHGQVFVFDPKTLNTLGSWRRANFLPGTLALASESAEWAMADAKGDLFIENMRSLDIRHARWPKPMTQVQADTHGSLFVGVADDHNLHALQILDGEKEGADGFKFVQSLLLPKDKMPGLTGCVSVAKGRILATRADGGLLAWADPAQPAQFWRELAADVTAITANPNAPELYTTHRDQSLRAWNLTEYTEKSRWQLSAQPTVVAHASDGRAVAVGMEDGQVRVYSLPHGGLLRSWSAHHGPVRCLAFAPHGLLASGGDDRRVVLLDPRSRNSARQLLRHDQPVQVLAFTHDGKTLASGSADGAIWFWYVPTRQDLFRLEPLAAPIRAMLFSPQDSRFLIAHGQDELTILRARSDSDAPIDPEPKPEE